MKDSEDDKQEILEDNKLKLEIQIANIGKMLLEQGGDLNILNKENQSAFQIAFKSKQLLLLKEFLPYLNLNTSKDILFNFRGMLVLDQFYIDYLIQLLSKSAEQSYSQVLNTVDKSGYTILLYLFKDYSQYYQVVLNKVH